MAMSLQSYQKRRFWQDTIRLEGSTLYVEYAYGMLVPTLYVSGRGRLYPAAVPASLFTGPGHADERKWKMGLISAALGAAASSTPADKAQDAALEKTCPVLHAFLTLLEEDGKPRTPSSLVVFTEDGQWKGCLSERDAGLQLWRTAESLQKLLQAIDRALASGSADWRKKFDPAARGKASRGKK